MCIGNSGQGNRKQAKKAQEAGGGAVAADPNVSNVVAAGAKGTRGGKQAMASAKQGAAPAVAGAIAGRAKKTARRRMKVALDVAVANVGGKGRSGLNIPTTYG